MDAQLDAPDGCRVTFWNHQCSPQHGDGVSTTFEGSDEYEGWGPESVMQSGNAVSGSFIFNAQIFSAHPLWNKAFAEVRFYRGANAAVLLSPPDDDYCLHCDTWNVAKVDGSTMQLTV